MKYFTDYIVKLLIMILLLSISPSVLYAMGVSVGLNGSAEIDVDEGGSAILNIVFKQDPSDAENCTATLTLNYSAVSQGNTINYTVNSPETVFEYNAVIFKKQILAKESLNTGDSVDGTKNIVISVEKDDIFNYRDERKIVISPTVVRTDACIGEKEEQLPAQTINIKDIDPATDPKPVNVSFSVDNPNPKEGEISTLVFSYDTDLPSVADCTIIQTITLLNDGSAVRGQDFNPTIHPNGWALNSTGFVNTPINEPIRLPINILQDNEVEPSELINIKVDYSTSSQDCFIQGGDSQLQTITIQDNDTPNPVDVSFTIENPNPQEGQTSNLVITYTPEIDASNSDCFIEGNLTLLSAIDENSATEGLDFTTEGIPDGQNLNYESGDDPGGGKRIVIPLQILNDDLIEPDETRSFSMEFSSNNGACPIRGNASNIQTITIKDTDFEESPLTVSLTADKDNPTEADSTVNLNVSFNLQGLSPPDTFCDVSVALRVVEDETTASSADFTFSPPTNINFGGRFESGNQESFSAPLQIINDTLVEQPETITIEAIFVSNFVNDLNSCPVNTLTAARTSTLNQKITITLRDDVGESGTTTPRDAMRNACSSLQNTTAITNSSLQNITATPNLTNGQTSLSIICQQDLSDKEIGHEEVFAMGSAIIETTKMQLTNINSRLIALRRGGTRRLDGSGIRMRINGETIPNVIFQGTGGAVFEPGGSDTDSLPDSIFEKGNSEGSVHEEKEGAYEAKGGGGGSADEPNDLLAMSRWGFFANGEFLFGEKDESTGERGFDFDSRGISIGADYRLPGDKLIIGGSLGYNDYDSSFTSEVGSMNLQGLHLSTYGTYMLSDKTYLDAIISLGRNKINISRPTAFVQAQLPAGLSQPVAIGTPNSNELSLSIGGGYEWHKKSLTITPFGRIDYTKATIDAYTETPSHSSALGSILSIDKQTLDSTTAVLGVRATYAVSTSKGVFLPQASIEWRHQFENNSRDIGATLVFDPTQTAFSVTSEKPDTDYLNIGLGVSAVFPKGRSGFIYIESRQGHDRITETAIKAGIRIEF